MTTRKKLNANKQNPNPKMNPGEELEDDLFLSDDNNFDADDLDLDESDDFELEFDEDDELDFDDDELDDDDLDSDDDELDDDDLDSDDDELDDDDLDSDDDGLDDDDLDSDDDGLDDDDLNSDNEGLDEDGDIFSDTVKLDNDPFAFIVDLRQPALPSNKKLLLTVKEVDYKNVSAEESKYGNAYKYFTISGEIKHPDTNETVVIKETGTTKNASFVRKVTAINNGQLPKNLNEIVGKKAVVTITHNTDDLGNVWDNLDTVEPYKPSSKKKVK